VPSRAFTGLPRVSTIDLGSAKYERYSSQGTSAINSGAGTEPGYAPQRACAAQPVSIQQSSVKRKRFDPLSRGVDSWIDAVSPSTITAAERIARRCD